MNLHFRSILAVSCFVCLNPSVFGAVTNSIGPGQILSGRIGGVGQTNFYSFTAAGGDVISAAVVRTNGLGSPRLRLYDPLGNLVYDHSSASLAYGPGLVLSRNGTFTFVVTEASLAGSYDYLLSLTKVVGGVNAREPGDAAEQILPGQIVGGRLGRADMDTYTFAALSGEVISVALARTNGLGNPYLYLYDPLGNLVIESGATAVVHLPVLALPRNGTYTFVIVEASLANTYDYLLSLTKVVSGVNVREPGDAAEQILPGQTLGGRIQVADMDTYTFSASSDDVISVALARTNGFGGPYLYLYDPLGNLVFAYGATPVTYLAGVRLSRNGTYMLVVFEAALLGSYDYLLSLTKVAGGVNLREPGDPDEPILPGQIVGGSIQSVDLDTYTFTAVADEVISLSLLRTNGLGSPYLYLYDPLGNLVFESGSPQVVHVPGVRLSHSGDYILVVVEGTLLDSYDYLLSVTSTTPGVNLREPGDGPETIVPGQFTGGHIGLADTDSFAFSADASDVVSIALLVTNGPGTYPWWQLYGPDGVLVASYATSPSLTYADQIRLPLTGTYTVLVLDNGLDEEFDYRLSVHLATGGNQREVGDGPEPILAGQFTGGHIELTDTDGFAFTAGANAVVSIALLVTNGPGAYPYWQLYGPDGNLVTANVSGPSLAYADQIRLPRTGTYRVLVLDNGLDEEFDYRLSVHLATGGNQREPGDGPEPIAPGQFTGGHIELTDTDGFAFSAEANDVVSIALLATNGPGTYPYWQLYGPDGTIVSYNVSTPSLAYLDQIRLPRTGTHRVLVLDNGLDEEFDYSLCLVKHPGPNASDPGDADWLVSPGQSVTGRIALGDLDTLGFRVIAGDSLRLELTISPGSGTYPVMQLLAPDGTLVGTGWGPDSATIQAICVAQTGFYQVFINDNGLDEEYEYTFSLTQWPVEPPSSGANQHLAIYRCDGRVYVRWPTNAVGFQLSSALALPPCSPPGGAGGCPTNWTPVLTAPSIVADHFYVDEGIPSGTKFYRLICTNGVNCGLVR